MKRSKFLTVISVLLAVMLLMAMTGCGDDVTTTGGSSTSSEGDVLSGDEQDTEIEIEGEGEGDGEGEATQIFLLSYVNMNYIETGDDNWFKLISGVEYTAPAQGNAYASVELAIDALREIPDGLDDADTMVTDAVVVTGISGPDDDGVITIELSDEALEEADMYTEQFMIYQIADTLISTFEVIDAVRFTLDDSGDGEMNYMDISEPYTADMVDEFIGGLRD